jgi:hypothetical protein
MNWNWLRWLAIAPALLACWYLALYVGLLALSFVQSLCPAELMISSVCTASWYPDAEKAVMCLGAALAAALMVLAGAILAPSGKQAVALVIYILGLAAAHYLAVHISSYVELASAALAGAMMLVTVRRFTPLTSGS